jgi:hypothetical protein
MLAFIDDCVAGVGGTSLTLDAIIEPHEDQVQLISTKEFSLMDSFKYEGFIFGNIMGFANNSFDAIIHTMKSKPFFKIEFDYGYCIYRGRIPHKVLGNQDCDCHKSTNASGLRKIYKLIHSNALHVFYMSEEQMLFHSEDLNFDTSQNKSVLSSCFTSNTMLQFSNLCKKKKNSKFAVIDGNGGWHSQAKGINEAIKHAENDSLNYEIIKTKTHKEMLDTLSNYHGLIFLPIIHDTCPRVTLEAKYMGLEVITNSRSQHTKEKWWNDSTENAFQFTQSRPNYFWKMLRKCLN